MYMLHVEARLFLIPTRTFKKYEKRGKTIICCQVSDMRKMFCFIIISYIQTNASSAQTIEKDSKSLDVNTYDMEFEVCMCN